MSRILYRSRTTRRAIPVAVAAVLVLFGAAASADQPRLPLSVGADVASGASRTLLTTSGDDSTAVASAAFTDVDVAYAFGPARRIPFRLGAEATYVRQTGGAGMRSAGGVGPTITLEAPVYLGAGLGVFTTDAPRQSVQTGSLETAVSVPTTAIVLGGQLFVGRRLLTTSAVGLSVQGTYRFFAAGSIVRSVTGVGLRISL